MNYVIFDIDGVINRTIKSYKKDRFGMLFDDENLELLETLINETNSIAICSSSWRCNGLKWLNECFKYRMVDFDIQDITPILGTNRFEEIQMWLDENNVENFIIIDDRNVDPNGLFGERFNKCDPKIGFSINEYNKAIKILNK